MSNILKVTQEGSSPKYLNAKLNGVQIPFLAKVEIISSCRELPRLVLTCVIEQNENDEVVIDIPQP